MGKMPHGFWERVCASENNAPKYSNKQLVFTLHIQAQHGVPISTGLYKVYPHANITNDGWNVWWT